jgi:hypothetical protein
MYNLIESSSCTHLFIIPLSIQVTRAYIKTAENEQYQQIFPAPQQQQDALVPPAPPCASSFVPSLKGYAPFSRANSTHPIISQLQQNQQSMSRGQGCNTGRSLHQQGLGYNGPSISHELGQGCGGGGTWL